jgi:hypothetical protein
LARSAEQYKARLESADAPRQGDYDGRGLLSEKRLIAFCEYILNTTFDQINYMSNLLQLDQLRNSIEHYVQARNDGRVAGLNEVKPIAALVLYNAFLMGKLERSTALELCAKPERSARRLLAQLREENLLREESPRSPLYWNIPEHAEPWHFPQLTPGL